MKCIYCKQDMVEPGNEHLFNRAFGCPNNLTIKGVCTDCNNYFGRELDLRLANDSVEGLIRNESIGSKSKKFVKAKRLVLRYDAPEESDLGNIYLWIDYENGGLMPATQFGLLNEKRKYEYFLLDDLDISERLERIKFLATRKLNSKSRWAMLGFNKEEYKKLIQVLEKGGLINKYKANNSLDFSLSSEKIPVSISGEIDLVIRRAIAKIAFNYLTKEQGDDFVLRKEFDKVREFIRYGKGENIVYIEKEPILEDEKALGKSFKGHIFTFERQGNVIFARISLFNSVHYKVILTSNTDSMILYMRKGLSYDPSTKSQKSLIARDK